MSKRNPVPLIRKRHRPRPRPRRSLDFPRDRKQRLQNLGETFPERRSEVMENEVWVCLWRSANVRDVVAEGDIMEGEIGGGTVGEVTDDEAVGLTAMFVQDEEVGKVFCATGFGDVVDDMGPSIYPCRIGEYKTDFLPHGEYYSENPMEYL